MLAEVFSLWIPKTKGVDVDRRLKTGVRDGPERELPPIATRLLVSFPTTIQQRKEEREKTSSLHHETSLCYRSSLYSLSSSSL